jgi:hypothetical protein
MTTKNQDAEPGGARRELAITATIDHRTGALAVGATWMEEGAECSMSLSTPVDLRVEDGKTSATLHPQVAVRGTATEVRPDSAGAHGCDISDAHEVYVFDTTAVLRVRVCATSEDAARRTLLRGGAITLGHRQGRCWPRPPGRMPSTNWSSWSIATA